MNPLVEEETGAFQNTKDLCSLSSQVSDFAFLETLFKGLVARFIRSKWFGKVIVSNLWHCCELCWLQLGLDIQSECIFSFLRREAWYSILFYLPVDRASMGPQTNHLCIRQSHLPSNEIDHSDRGVIFTLNPNYCAVFCSHFGIPTSQHRPIHSCLLDLSMHIHESQQLGDIWGNCSASKNHSNSTACRLIMWI